MSPVGVWSRKKERQADFHRPRHDAKFGYHVWDGENQCDIELFLTKHQPMVLHIDI